MKKLLIFFAIILIAIPDYVYACSIVKTLTGQVGKGLVTLAVLIMIPLYVIPRKGYNRKAQLKTYNWLTYSLAIPSPFYILAAVPILVFSDIDDIYLGKWLYIPIIIYCYVIVGYVASLWTKCEHKWLHRFDSCIHILFFLAFSAILSGQLTPGPPYQYVDDYPDRKIWKENVTYCHVDYKICAWVCLKGHERNKK